MTQPSSKRKISIPDDVFVRVISEISDEIPVVGEILGTVNDIKSKLDLSAYEITVLDRIRSKRIMRDAIQSFDPSIIGDLLPKDLFFLKDDVYSLLFKDTLNDETLALVSSMSRDDKRELAFKVLYDNTFFQPKNFVIDERLGTVCTKDFRHALIIEDGNAISENKISNNRFNLKPQDIMIITSAIILANYGIISIDTLRKWLAQKYGKRGAFIDIRSGMKKFVHVLFWSPPRDAIVRKIRERHDSKSKPNK